MNLKTEVKSEGKVYTVFKEDKNSNDIRVLNTVKYTCVLLELIACL